MGYGSSVVEKLKKGYSGLTADQVRATHFQMQRIDEKDSTYRTNRVGCENMAEEWIEGAVRETIISVLTKHGAKRIAIFGSYARGEATKESDIDILIRFKSPKSLFELVHIENELKSVLKKEVDLITEQSVSPYLSGSIHRDELVIYEE